MNKNVTSPDLILNKGKQLGWSTNYPAFNIKKEKREHHRNKFLKIELSFTFLDFVTYIEATWTLLWRI